MAETSGKGTVVTPDMSRLLLSDKEVVTVVDWCVRYGRRQGGLPASHRTGGKMAISADLLDAPGRPVTPAELIREVIPEQPVILVGPSATWDAFGVTAWLEERGWSWTHAADAERARWLTAIQKVSLVLVAGDERAVWEIVEAIRPITMAPLVVLARPAPAGVISLVRVGVDAVVDPTCGAEEVFARVVALLRRSDHGWVPGVRYLGSDGLRIDLWAQECDLDGQPLHLSPTE